MSSSRDRGQLYRYRMRGLLRGRAGSADAAEPEPEPEEPPEIVEPAGLGPRPTEEDIFHT